MTSSVGKLRLQLDKATYERVGLSGKPIADCGQKHKLNRFGNCLELLKVYETSIDFSSQRSRSTCVLHLWSVVDETLIA